MPVYQKDACPVCRSTKYKLIGKAGKGNTTIKIEEEPYVVECKNCHLLYINPIPHWTDEDFKILYDESYFKKQEYKPEWLDIRANKNVASRFKRIKKHLATDNKKLLEVGSGIFAFMSKYLSKHGWEVIAQEPSDELCRMLSTEYPELKTTTEPFTSIESKEKFGLIYADSVFEHVPNPLDYIKKSSELLDNGGILYFISPNEYSFYQWIKTRVSKIKNNTVKYLTPYQEPYHLIGFSKKSMQIAADKSGLVLAQYMKKHDYYWYHAVKSNKNPLLKYPVALVLYLMDIAGWGGNLEIMFKKK